MSDINIIKASLSINWNKFNTKILPCCGKEKTGIDCKVLVFGPENLSIDEINQFKEQCDYLCSECFDVWKTDFWHKKRENKQLRLF